MQCQVKAMEQKVKYLLCLKFEVIENGNSQVKHKYLKIVLNNLHLLLCHIPSVLILDFQDFQFSTANAYEFQISVTGLLHEATNKYWYHH